MALRHRHLEGRNDSDDWLMFWLEVSPMASIASDEYYGFLHHLVCVVRFGKVGIGWLHFCERLRSKRHHSILQGRYDEADGLYVRCIEVQEGALGPDHPELAVILNNRAILLRRQVRR